MVVEGILESSTDLGTTATEGNTSNPGTLLWNACTSLLVGGVVVIIFATILGIAVLNARASIPSITLICSANTANTQRLRTLKPQTLNPSMLWSDVGSSYIFNQLFYGMNLLYII